MCCCDDDDDDDDDDDVDVDVDDVHDMFDDKLSRTETRRTQR